MDIRGFLIPFQSSGFFLLHRAIYERTVMQARCHDSVSLSHFFCFFSVRTKRPHAVLYIGWWCGFISREICPPRECHFYPIHMQILLHYSYFMLQCFFGITAIFPLRGKPVNDFINNDWQTRFYLSGANLLPSIRDNCITNRSNFNINVILAPSP